MYHLDGLCCYVNVYVNDIIITRSSYEFVAIFLICYISFVWLGFVPYLPWFSLDASYHVIRAFLWLILSCIRVALVLYKFIVSPRPSALLITTRFQSSVVWDTFGLLWLMVWLFVDLLVMIFMVILMLVWSDALTIHVRLPAIMCSLDLTSSVNAPRNNIHTVARLAPRLSIVFLIILLLWFVGVLLCYRRFMLPPHVHQLFFVTILFYVPCS